METISRLAEDIPVVSVAEKAVTEGEASALMFIGVGFESNAHLAALYAADILQGNTSPGELDVGVVSPPDIAINFLKARQLGLRIPFELLEAANTVYGHEGRLVFKRGRQLAGSEEASQGGTPR
jgi:putative ABC transport system substrate-binding protein